MEKEKMGIQADSTHEGAPASSLESQSAEVERKARVDAVWEQMSKGVSVKTLKSVSVKCSSTVNKPTQKSSMSWMTYLGLAPKKAASPVQEKQPTPTPVHNGNSDEAKRLAAAALSAVKDAAASAATSGKGKVEVMVTLVALSLDGCVMGTVKTRLPEEGIGGLVRLKFWTRGQQNKDFSLSTVVYEPHQESYISAIAFHPSSRMAVSSSYGGDFKVWIRNHEISRKDQMLQKTGWTCHVVGSYKKKPLTAAAFSADGSVLAVAAETVITLWDPEKNVLVTVIGDSLEPIESLSFLGKSEHLVSTSRGSNPQVSVWSMSKLSVSWSYKLHAEGSRAMNVSSIRMFGGILSWGLQLGINCCVLMGANIVNEDTAPGPPIVQGHKLVAIKHFAVSLEDTRDASS